MFESRKYIYLIYKFTTSVRPWRSSGFTPTGPGSSCSKNFLSKDLWFPNQNFLFPEFSFKRSVFSELGVQADWARPVGRNFMFPEFSFKRSVLYSCNSRASSPSIESTAIYVLSIFMCTTWAGKWRRTTTTCTTSVYDGARVQAYRAGVLSVEVLKPRSLLKLSP
jgi:hypothetical protein